MPRNASETRKTILDAAYRQFYKRGYNRVGVVEIAAAANVTKRTLYVHFESKDRLLAEAMEYYRQLATQQTSDWAERLTGNAGATIDSLFDDLGRWASRPRFAASGFTRLAMELADMPGHPARAVARRHKAFVESVIASALGKARVARPGDRAREILLLLEGATALMLIHNDPSYAAAAKAAAKRSGCSSAALDEPAHAQHRNYRLSRLPAAPGAGQHRAVGGGHERHLRSCLVEMDDPGERVIDALQHVVGAGPCQAADLRDVREAVRAGARNHLAIEMQQQLCRQLEITEALGLRATLRRA
jgi:AcrR family transcriptional regulator